ncbi:forkhead box protein N4 isoform X2 [Oryctolagus cuniculus]|uniref:forkhead box protein N4 isoform X2 n=1 Tax=Oryctolagus cuniculus TaxID=9986 RepID=UPI00387A1570
MLSRLEGGLGAVRGLGFRKLPHPRNRLSPPTPPELLAPLRRLLASTSNEDLPGDLQSLSWLTAVDVPRLQQMVNSRVDLGGPRAPHPHTGAPAGAADLHVGPTPGPLLPGPAGMAPRSLLGLGPVASHGVSMSQFSVGGQPSPRLQDTSQLYPPATQPPFPLPPGAQQCPPAGLYGSPFGARPPYPQPHMAVLPSQELRPKHYPKPIYSYSCLIAMALKNSKTGSLPVSEIYSFMKEHFPYFKTAPDGWKNSVRHNLSLNKCFEKVENKAGGSSRKGCLWALNLARIDKMEEELHKCKRKDLAAIRRSMANPEELDKLISDRPESCRRPGKPGEPEPPGLLRPATATMAHGCLAVSQLPPQPLRTLSLQSVPLNHQVQPQAHLAPDSPAPAQTPPLHALPALSPGPLPHPAVGRGPVDFINIGTDMNTEVDALDPSIVDFALQGNLWEEMKEDGFSLDALGTFGDSPLGCDLGASGLTSVPGGSEQGFADVQLTGLYAAYSNPDGVAAAGAASSTQYLGAPGNKPIALL